MIAATSNIGSFAMVGHRLTRACTLFALSAVSGCGDKQPPPPIPPPTPPAAKAQFVQPSWAKDMNGPCERHPAEFYAEKVKTKEGIEELIVMSCRYEARGNYHEHESKQGGDTPKAGPELDATIACIGERLYLLKSLQRAGVMKAKCPEE